MVCFIEETDLELTWEEFNKKFPNVCKEDWEQAQKEFQEM